MVQNKTSKPKKIKPRKDLEYYSLDYIDPPYREEFLELVRIRGEVLPAVEFRIKPNVSLDRVRDLPPTRVEDLYGIPIKYTLKPGPVIRHKDEFPLAKFYQCGVYNFSIYSIYSRPIPEIIISSKDTGIICIDAAGTIGDKDYVEAFLAKIRLYMPKSQEMSEFSKIAIFNFEMKGITFDQNKEEVGQLCHIDDHIIFNVGKVIFCHSILDNKKNTSKWINNSQLRSSSNKKKLALVEKYLASLPSTRENFINRYIDVLNTSNKALINQAEKSIVSLEKKLLKQAANLGRLFFTQKAIESKSEEFGKEIEKVRTIFDVESMSFVENGIKVITKDLEREVDGDTYYAGKFEIVFEFLTLKYSLKARNLCCTSNNPKYQHPHQGGYKDDICLGGFRPLLMSCFKELDIYNTILVVISMLKAVRISDFQAKPVFNRYWQYRERPNETFEIKEYFYIMSSDLSTGRLIQRPHNYNDVDLDEYDEDDDDEDEGPIIRPQRGRMRSIKSYK